MTWKYAFLVSYVGTSYCGWQKQKPLASGGKESIQGCLERALIQLTHESSAIVASGRTDSGVHALGQVAHFTLRTKEWPVLSLQRGFNSILPASIRVSCVQEVPIDFHAQRSAQKKQYSYYFQQGPSPLPHLEPLSWWIQKKLDFSAMAVALQSLVGEHDFKPFQASGSKPGSTIRKILEAEMSVEPLPFPCVSSPLDHRLTPFLIRMRIVGTGFLKQMVRGIAGTLLQIGEGRRPPSCMADILKTRDRLQVGPTAPARALWLEKVWYAQVLDWDTSRVVQENEDLNLI